MKKFMWIPMFASFALLAAACGDDSPLCVSNCGDSPTLPAGCTASAPANLSAQVSSLGCDASTCTASYNVSSLSVLVRTQWSFPGGSPSESDNSNGTVHWPRRGNAGQNQDWVLKGCGCPQADDIDGASCRSTNGRVTFTAAD